MLVPRATLAMFLAGTALFATNALATTEVNYVPVLKEVLDEKPVEETHDESYEDDEEFPTHDEYSGEPDSTINFEELSEEDTYETLQLGGAFVGVGAGFGGVGVVAGVGGVGPYYPYGGYGYGYGSPYYNYGWPYRPWWGRRW